MLVLGNFSIRFVKFLTGFWVSLFCFRYVDAVLTIPKGTLFPMCGMNLAFQRELIGPAMYFGLMGDGQPIGRYDDMWAGWCVKVRIFYLFLFL